MGYRALEGNAEMILFTAGVLIGSWFFVFPMIIYPKFREFMGKIALFIWKFITNALVWGLSLVTLSIGLAIKYHSDPLSWVNRWGAAIMLGVGISLVSLWATAINIKKDNNAYDKIDDAYREKIAAQNLADAMNLPFPTIADYEAEKNRILAHVEQEYIKSQKNEDPEPEIEMWSNGYPAEYSSIYSQTYVVTGDDQVLFTYTEDE
jgi:uncharacterized membrane protein (DUF485 family)